MLLVWLQAMAPTSTLRELGFSPEAYLAGPPCWDSVYPCALQAGGLIRLGMPTFASTRLSDQALAILKSQ